MLVSSVNLKHVKGHCRRQRQDSNLRRPRPATLGCLPLRAHRAPAAHECAAATALSPQRAPAPETGRRRRARPPDRRPRSSPPAPAPPRSRTEPRPSPTSPDASAPTSRPSAAGSRPGSSRPPASAPASAIASASGLRGLPAPAHPHRRHRRAPPPGSIGGTRRLSSTGAERVDRISTPLHKTKPCSGSPCGASAHGQSRGCDRDQLTFPFEPV